MTYMHRCPRAILYPPVPTISHRLDFHQSDCDRVQSGLAKVTKLPETQAKAALSRIERRRSGTKPPASKSRSSPPVRAHDLLKRPFWIQQLAYSFVQGRSSHQSEESKVERKKKNLLASTIGSGYLLTGQSEVLMLHVYRYTDLKISEMTM